MVDITKLDMTAIWASGGDKIDPGATKVNGGWQVEAVPRQTWNWMQNRVDQNVAYMLQKGIPEWDNLTEYQANKSYVQRNNVVYRALLTGSNQDPQTATTYWVRAFATYTNGLNVLGAVTPAANGLVYFPTTTTVATTNLTAFARTILDDGDAATVRATIGAQLLNTNLNGLSALAGGTNDLPYFTGSGAMAATTLTAFGRSLLDDNDASAARTTLGLKGGAISDVSTTNAPTTANLLLKVGDYGWGAGLANGLPAMDPPNGDLNLALTAGVYRVSSTTTNVPNGFGQGALVISMMWNNATGAQIITQNGNSAMRGGSNLVTTPAWTGWAGVWNSNSLTKTSNSRDSTAGAMLQVGDFGIGSTVAPNVANLNTLTVAGMYSVDGSNIIGAPVGSNGMVIHSDWSSTAAASQIYITTSDGTGRMFFRSRTSDTWQAWKENITTSNQQSVIDLAVNSANANAANLYFPKTGGTVSGGLVIDAAGNASIELGNKTRASTPFIDFNSSSGNTDYDSRILGSGGSSAGAGNGALTYTAIAGHFFNGNVTANAGYGFYGPLLGNANTASALQTARTISITGAASGSVAFNGSANVAIPITIAISGVTNLQATLDGKLSAQDLSNTYYSKSQSDGRYVAGTNAGLVMQNSVIPTISGATDAYSGNSIRISNGGNNGASAVISFVRDGSFGTWFGLDTDNELAWGGWSHGNNRYRLWTERNFNPAVYATISNVSTIMAQTAYNASGQYCFAQNVTGSTIEWANGMAGSNLRPTSNGVVNNSVSLPGTWRCMGYGSPNAATLWQRYA